MIVQTKPNTISTDTSSYPVIPFTYESLNNYFFIEKGASDFVLCLENSNYVAQAKDGFIYVQHKTVAKYFTTKSGSLLTTGSLRARRTSFSSNYQGGIFPKVSPEEQGDAIFEPKFHISLQEAKNKDKIYHGTNFCQGFNLIKDILISEQYNIKSFKVADMTNIMACGAQGLQRGKDITIFINTDPGKSIIEYWNPLLTEIITKLVINQVKPGFAPIVEGDYDRKDKLIRGTTYISYRYEKEKQGNLFLDRFQNLEIKVDGQDPNDKWQAELSFDEKQQIAFIKNMLNHNFSNEEKSNSIAK
jgi:hypothetical protein